LRHPAALASSRRALNALKQISATKILGIAIAISTVAKAGDNRVVALTKTT
jgi:hypothetical protein